MKKTVLALGLLAPAIVSQGFAAEGPVPAGIPHLDHVFVIVMENHAYGQIFNNPNTPYINALTTSANLATNFFAIAHPSLTNYLEMAGGSNFGVLSDNDPDWHNGACTTNLASKIPATDNPATGNICPISGIGTDAATPAIDFKNETNDPHGLLNIDGVASIPAASTISGQTIADQLIARKISWKSYQEGLPPEGADLVNYSDGDYTNNTDFSKIVPPLNPPLTQGDVVKLYAAKHNPFVYFKSIQESHLANSVAFDGAQGLYADLAHGTVPVFSFIVPNQCNDQHGRGNAGAFCNFDPDDNGTQAGLNPALIFRGDIAVKEIVNAIHASPAWTATVGTPGFGGQHANKSAIILLWDENDYSPAPTKNRIIFVVDTNYGVHGVKSSNRYTHFSLLKSIEAGLGLPCLNHACDADVSVISDLFRVRKRHGARPDHSSAVPKRPARS